MQKANSFPVTRFTMAVVSFPHATASANLPGTVCADLTNVIIIPSCNAFNDEPLTNGAAH